MPTKFYTLFGNNIHGIKVTWGNDPAATGDKSLAIDFELNMYAAKPTFGITGGVPVTIGGTTISPEPWVTSSNWNSATNVLGSGITVQKLYDFMLVWTNPVSTAFPKYDGFCAQMIATIGSDNL